MPKLVLINPVNPAKTGLTVNKSSRFPPISLGIIAALTPPDWEIEVLDENWEPFVYHDADLVGITAFTTSAPRAYAIASVYKSKGIPVVMGGIHASTCKDEALLYVDTVVVGEAESVWSEVIRDFQEGNLKRIYYGRYGDLKGATAPRRDLFNPSYLFASIQTSRGCPMNCDFCSVTAFNGRRYRRRLNEEILRELESIPQQMLFFVDDNIIGYGEESKNATLDLFKRMAEQKLNKLWFCQASINFADDEEVLKWAARAGCKMVFLGLEAEETGALGVVDKHLNLQRGVDSYQQAFLRIHKAGIAVLGAFIFGMDGDTLQKLEKRSHYMISSQIDVMQTTYLTPLPGTRLFDRYHSEKRLLYNDFPGDWTHYDMTEVVFMPEKMTPQELKQGMREANERMYSNSCLMRKAINTFGLTRDMMAAMFAWSSNQNYKKVFKGTG